MEALSSSFEEIEATADDLLKAVSQSMDTKGLALN
jgi:hypothetical protein